MEPKTFLYLQGMLPLLSADCLDTRLFFLQVLGWEVENLAQIEWLFRLMTHIHDTQYSDFKPYLNLNVFRQDAGGSSLPPLFLN